MNTETDYLKTIAEEILASRKFNETNQIKPNKFLETEAKRLEKAVMLHLNALKNQVQYDTFFINIMNKLVSISDLLTIEKDQISPDVHMMTDLIHSLRILVSPEVTGNIRLSKAFLILQRPVIGQYWADYEITMKSCQIDETLVKVAAIPFKRFIANSPSLFWRDFTWLKSYQGKLDIMDWKNTDCNSHTEALMSLLIGRDFNDDRFYIYCKKYIQHRVGDRKGKTNRLLEFANCEKLVLQDTQIGMPSFDPRANSVSARLIKWISEETAFIRIHEKEHPHAKLHFYLPNYKIAFLFKLFSEHKLFGDTPFKEIARQIAATCLSQDGADILPQTIISKAYPKDISTLEDMERLLNKMLDYVRRFTR